MKFITTILLLSFATIVAAQENLNNDFQFEYQWGLYGHYKVSSERELVYVKDVGNTYLDTTISFTEKEKKDILDKVIEIGFFEYPNYYNPQPPQIPYSMREYFMPIDSTFQQMQIDTLNDLIDTTFIFNIVYSKDTIWMPLPMYKLSDVIPHPTCILTISWQGKNHTVKFDNSRKLYEYKEKEWVYVTDKKFDDLCELGKLIEKHTTNKDEFVPINRSSIVYR